MVVVALFALLFLPSFVQTARTEAWAGSNDETPAAPPREPYPSTTSEFPYAVNFKQGATRFLNGDNCLP